MAPCAPCFPESSLTGIEQSFLDISIETDGFLLFKPIAEGIASNRTTGEYGNATVASNGDAHGDGDVGMHHDPSAEEDDDGSVASRLLGGIGKSMSNPSLLSSAFNCCKEIVRETPFQRSFRLRNMNLQQCTEELGSESYSSAEASAEDSTFNAILDERCPLCGIAHMREEYCPKKEGEAKLSVPTISCTFGLKSNTGHPSFSTNHMKRSKSTSAFPPPLCSSVYGITANSGKDCGDHGVLLQRVRQDGRLLLKEVKTPRPPYPHLRAARGGGRLTLFLRHHHSDSTWNDDDDAPRDNYTVPCDGEAPHQDEYCPNHNICPAAIATDISPPICVEGGKASCKSYTSICLSEKSDISGHEYPEVVEEPVLTQREIATFTFSSVGPIPHASWSSNSCYDLQPTEYPHKLQLQTTSAAALAINSDVVIRVPTTSPGGVTNFIAVTEFRDDDGPPFSQHRSADHVNAPSTGRYDLPKTPLTARSSEWLHCKELSHLHCNELDKIKMQCVATR